MNILSIFKKYGYEAYFVGGYPRDKYLGIETEDYDICTNAKPEEIKSIFNEYNDKYEKYGCITIRYNKNNYQITTFRKDLSFINNRYPIIEYVKTLEEDLERRDFTINALCIDSDNNYIDYLNSRKDLDDKIIRVIGETDKKISEDPLRILRAIRFASKYNFQIEEELKISMHKHAHLIKKLNKIKVRDELDKIKKYKGNNLLIEFNIREEEYNDK